MMRIATLTSILNPYSSTGAADALQVSQLLSKMGQEVAIYTTDHLQPVRTYDGVSIKRFKPVLTIRKFKISLDLLKELKSIDVDVMHVHGYRGFEAIAASYARKFKPIPLIISTYGTVPYVYSFDDKFFKMLEDALTLRFQLRTADLFLPETEFETEELAKFGVPKHRMRIVYEKVDVNKFRRVEGNFFRADGPIVLFVGRVCRIKNIELLISAFHKVIQQVPEAKLAIVGPIEDQRYMSGLKRLVSHLGLNGSVKFCGPVRYDELPEVYSSVDLLVLPSWWENIGGVLIEALSCECPVIATDVGGTREVISHGKTGFLVKLGDIQTLAEGIILLLSDNKLRRQMGDNGRHTVIAKFSTEAFMERLLSAYHDAISRGKK